MLRVVDISSHQGDAGIDVRGLDCDCLFVKVSGGTYYENPYWREHADAALASGKRLGLYHYARDLDGAWSEPQAEARYFLDRIGDYLGKCAIMLDWEKEGHGYDEGWIHEWLDTVSRETGSVPFFYIGANDLSNYDFRGLTDYPLWFASYLFRYEGAGWVDDPANIWPTGAWERMAMYQYTSTGDIWGYDGPLDLSVFYGDAGDWDALIEDDLDPAEIWGYML